MTTLDIAAATVEELRRGAGAARPGRLRRRGADAPPRAELGVLDVQGARRGGEVFGDGLVAEHDHLVYFPEPWRVLAGIAHESLIATRI